MSFIVCKIQSLENGRKSIHRIQSLVVGGKQGLLARNLLNIPQGVDGNWSLTARELLTLELPESSDDTSVFFDLTPRSTEQKRLLYLVDVYGRTMSLITDLVCHFKILTRIEPQPAGSTGEFTAADWRNAVDIYEHMRLNGGFAGGDWVWTEPSQPVCGPDLERLLDQLNLKMPNWRDRERFALGDCAYMPAVTRLIGSSAFA